MFSSFRRHEVLCLVGLLIFCWLPALPSLAQMQKLRIGPNARFLVKEDGEPFVWIGDTNWFFAKLPPATIDSLLDKRSQQGYTMMFVSCREKLYNGDGPGDVTNHNEAWWSYLDDYIEKCAQRNLYVGITLGWWGLLRKSTPEELYRYGHWVGDRYKARSNIVWLTLGEAGGHLRKGELDRNKMNALVRGIREGDSGDKLLTVHADYQRGTSLSSDGELSDFNNWQTSQWCCPDDLPRKDERSWTVWEAIDHDYKKLYDGKPKPTLDSEAWYESNKDFCGAEPFHIRRRAYFTLLAGAFGHTYGAGGLWDGLVEKEGCSPSASVAIANDGARHIGYLSNFLHDLGRDFLALRPDQDFIVSGNSSAYDRHIQASVTSDRSLAIAYSAGDAAYDINLGSLSIPNLAVLWFNPRTGEYEEGRKISTVKNTIVAMNPPGELGPGNDWVMIVGHPKIIRRRFK